ncbi:MAG: protein kinase [Planctomycetes bacterium]|nr:protein kinase [Planctomycetota bacterium]
MSPKRMDDLVQLIAGLRLVAPALLNACAAEAESSADGRSELMRIFEARSLLTSFQIAQIEKGETDLLVLGRYKLLYRNASGSFARVFRAESVDDGRMVGLKLLRQRWAKDRNAVIQFHREAKLCKRLQHKNIVPIYEVGQQGDYHFFTMEFIEGGNLRDFITIRKKLSPAETVRCILEMCEGLEYALRQGITHRDLKLTNVLMSSHGVAKLVDFGLAGEGSASGTASGDGVLRALEYATLEKGTNAADDDPRSDLFFLGTIFYELITGVSPYPRTRSREERKRLSRYSQIRPVEAVDRSLPASVTAIIERLMQLNPNERYQTPTEVIEDLQRTVGEIGVPDNGRFRNRTLPQSVADPQKPNDRHLPTVMCIESRAKHQDILREYLSKHGFRVLVLNDVQRGLNRIKTNPPDCTVLMGESIGDDVGKAFEQMLRTTETGRMVGIAVLSKKQDRLKSECRQTKTARVMVQPITHRELRREIHLALQRNKKDSHEADAPAG